MMRVAIPMWVMGSIGKRVELVRAFVGPTRVYPPMHQGVLVGLMYDEESHGSYALVALDESDLTYMENFAYSEIRPPLGRSVQYEIAEGYLLPSDDGYAKPFQR